MKIPMSFRMFFFFLSILLVSSIQSQDLPDTGISGVYEVMVGTDDGKSMIKYFGEYGFTVVDSSSLKANEALEIYGVNSTLKSYRLQNGDIDSHGLLRILAWDKLRGPGIGYMPPETIGMRMAVMKTDDIFRLYDVYKSARENGKKWLPIEPIADDLFGLNDGDKDFYKRPVLVRENAVYGEFFNHVFFQRYGYHIEGYGTIGDHAKLKTSEFTHHDFIIKVDDMEVMSYLSSALGLKAESEPVIDGDWQKGPKQVFQMSAGESHWYQGFVSPNNICGKLKFFSPRGPKPDKRHNQRIGEKGITLHSFYTAKLDDVFQRVGNHGLNPKPIVKNEFGERSFIFTGPGGCSWQIIEKFSSSNKPVTELKFSLTEN